MKLSLLSSLYCKNMLNIFLSSELSFILDYIDKHNINIIIKKIIYKLINDELDDNILNLILYQFNNKIDIIAFNNLIINNFYNKLPLEKYNLYGYLILNKYDLKLEKLFDSINNLRNNNYNDTVSTLIKHFIICFMTNYLYENIYNLLYIYLKYLNIDINNINLEEILNNNSKLNLESLQKIKDFLTTLPEVNVELFE